MRTLPVILLQEKVKRVLLAPVRELGWNVVLKGSVHPFMPSVLDGHSRLDPLGADAQLNPPLRQLTDTADGQRSKGAPLSVRIASGQDILAKHPLESGLDGTIAGVLQGPAQKQIARKVVSNGQRITALMVAKAKSLLKSALQI